mgnify:CR=1 FL=1
MAKKNKQWGASFDEWQGFIDLGLTEDLLPVVSNPDAPVSENSTMKQLGKTPSLFNRQGNVVGIGKWTERHSTEKEVQRWTREPDYGICIQTRHVRGIDIDVDDEATAREIAKEIEDFIGFCLPRRTRSNSGKMLLAVIVEGEFGKKTVKVDGGMIEMLANGQQFIAAGTHTSGVRYEWSYLEEQLPVLTQEQWDDLIWFLQEGFGISKSTGRGLRKRDDGDAVPDSTYDFLEENGHVLEYGSEGQLHIECPFTDGHSTESTISSTSYFPKGSRGYERGHFVCLHASCEHRTDEDFERALGVQQSKMEVLTLDEEEQALELPGWERDKHGRPKAVVNNLLSALRRPDLCGTAIHYDSFKDEIVFKTDDRWERENDERFTLLKAYLEREQAFLPIGRDAVRDAVRVVAKENTIDTATRWLCDLKWDGTHRIERFVSDYLGGDDTPYARSVSLYIWTAAAGRVMEPGLKADMIPIMKGPQGYRKSTAIAAMVPDQELFCEIDFDEKDDDLARKMRGVLVAEIPELRGLRTRAIEAIKAFVARTHEKWIPKYKEFSTTFPRRCVFIATTNDDEFLADSTGNRRWLPFEVKRFTDVGAIVRDRAQLWAEARERFKEDGLLWKDAEELATQHHELYMMRDAWFDVISDWMDRPQGLDGEGQRPADMEYLRVIDIARDALNIDPRQLKRVDELKIADTLKALGYENRAKRLNINGVKKPVKVWFAPEFDLA